MSGVLLNYLKQFLKTHVFQITLKKGKVPGRPQDGKDGNRINRWLMDKNHKFYATELDATLVEIKYYLQAFSMENAPTTDHLNISIKKIFNPWLIEHEVKPGLYKDPLLRVNIDFKKFIDDPSDILYGPILPEKED